MLTQQTLRKLNELKLFGMYNGFEVQLADTAAQALGYLKNALASWLTRNKLIGKTNGLSAY
jgi:hypothetical protein